MISVKEAQNLIKRNTFFPGVRKIQVENSLGYILAQDIKAPISLPVMDNSAMDGYVLRAKDVEAARHGNPVLLKIRGVLKAGDSGHMRLREGEAYQIMTGAPIPIGADTVLTKEAARVQNRCLVVDHALPLARHIRREGEEIKKGVQVLKRNAVIHPGTIAVLTSLGIRDVKVFKKPRVSVIATGSELVKPGRFLRPGKIYDSNSSMIAASLRDMGIDIVLKKTVRDQPKAIRRVIQKALGLSEAVILLGGVSVGDYDYVKDILKKLGVKTIFWKVKQKPGKPLYFGKRKNTLIFGLPGNPASAYICFYEYVYSALRLMSGFQKPDLLREHVRIENEVKSDPQKSVFLKGKLNQNHQGNTVLALRYQGSHMVSSLHEANGFIVLPQGVAQIERGELVIVDRLPHSREDRS